MRVAFLSILLLAAGAPAYAQSVGEIEMPEPPEGFTWQILPEIKAAFLRPVGWYFLAEQQGDTRAYFITKQNIEIETVFTVGLSINVVFRVKERTGLSALAYAQSYIAGVARVSGGRILSTWDGTQGPLQTYGIRFESDKEDETVVIIHQIAMVNTSTNTLYLISLEAPESEWEDAWIKGEYLMQWIAVDQSM